MKIIPTATFSNLMPKAMLHDLRYSLYTKLSSELFSKLHTDHQPSGAYFQIAKFVDMFIRDFSGKNCSFLDIEDAPGGGLRHIRDGIFDYILEELKKKERKGALDQLTEESQKLGLYD